MTSTLSGAQHNDPTVPEQIGKYVVVKRVGKGSSGTVYLSHDPFYGRDVAYALDGSYVGTPYEFIRASGGAVRWIRVNGRIARREG